MRKDWTKGNCIYKVNEYWTNGYIVVKANNQIRSFIESKMFRSDIDINSRAFQNDSKPPIMVFSQLAKGKHIEATVSEFKVDQQKEIARVVTTDQGNFLINEKYLAPFIHNNKLKTFAVNDSGSKQPPILIYKCEDEIVAIVLPMRNESIKIRINQIKHEVK